ncbi:hypothetical protein W97_04313 [Coniosporium apollinis CBS 100218]|uniref:Uncharacterized protein n=1 Tax=Coniosporium apollinis (strain CBS 100218) TaxID=1168221 RepID=R7YTB8_CONA1|nr:uncharacterized protein W97_04313 [Coniosporium apollinis CBS 100218]EON65078.1 hypothetical protein W97_04313 [Coniosporium apollinis CBS 100218]
MVTTRSGGTAQTHLEDFTDSKSSPTKKPRTAAAKGSKTQAKPSRPAANTSKPRASSPTPPKTSRKRKAPDDPTDEPSSPPAKKPKTTRPSASKPSAKQDEKEQDDKPVIINRAPVLQLWAASVTHLLHPSFAWSTCLSAGSAISSLCAISKGRSIGTIEPAKETEEKAERRKRAKKEQEDLEEMEVMGFKLKVKNGLVVAGSDKKGKPGSEASLKAKFGDEAYNRTKAAFEKALEAWKGAEEELNEKAFGFYERFRPEVSAGQKGWGRKAELDLQKVGRVAGR